MRQDSGLRSRYDAVIVGARCAGAATALLLARRGLRVLLVDRSAYGTDTLSTHALMRGAVLQLRRWGILDAIVAAGTPAVTETSFQYGRTVIHVSIKPRDGVAALYAPRRTVLDRALVDAARLAGAHVVFGAHVNELVQDADGRVTGVVLAGARGGRRSVEADVTIGADGLRSTVARLTRAPVYRRGTHATGVIYAYWQGLPNAGYQWLYDLGVSAGVVPTNEGLSCVFASMPAARFRREIGAGVERLYQAVIAETSPALAGSLGAAVRAGHFHGFPGEPGFMRRSWGSGWALVGDAGYFKDPLTAHGITDALRDAELLANAVAAGSPLAAYEAARDDIATPQFEATDAIASFEWSLESLQPLHRAMVDEMARETRLIRSLSEDDRSSIPRSRYSA